MRWAVEESVEVVIDSGGVKPVSSGSCSASEVARRAGADTVILAGAGHGLLADVEPVRSRVLEHLRQQDTPT